MDNPTSIIVRGAREHNLQNVSLELPRDSLIVFTGVSGSGKSSLAFDTLYAEGQRRYVESLSSYARQFLGQLPKPDVDYIGGLSPAISIQQKTAVRNPRSTVGTITEISDYLRVLFARIGQGHCPQCARPITAQSREQIIGRILSFPEGSSLLILAPLVVGQKGEFKDLFADLVKRGYIRARVDGEVVRLTDNLQLDRRIKHNIEVVVDRLKLDGKVRPRLAEAVEQALHLANGNLIISIEHPRSSTGVNGLSSDPQAAGAFVDIPLSAHYACVHCQKSFAPPTPQLFSFNSPQGMCLDCDGLGSQYTFDANLLIPDPSLSFEKGALELVGPFRGMGRWRKHIYQGVAESLGIDLKKPWQDLPAEHQAWLLHGAGDRSITYTWKQRGGGVWKHGGKWEGIIPQLLTSFKKTNAGPRRAQLEKYMRVVRCSSCGGHRLNPQARAVRVGDRSLIELGNTPIGELVPWFSELAEQLDPVQRTIASEVLKEIKDRLGFLLNVGLHYLSLDRSAPTLSGGEAQRIRLAGQIGSGLVGVLYILDEPSIGLHPRDNDRLLRSLEQLRDMGNTVLVVEHDEDTMRAANFLVDFGPGPGVRGGNIVAAGSPRDVIKNPKSLTGQYLSGKQTIPTPSQRREPSLRRLRIEGARHNNLKNIDVEIPLGLFVTITGVSGSGKSSLINDILLEGTRVLLQRNGKPLDDDQEVPEVWHTLGEHDRILGVEHLDKVIAIDQAPIGRTPRSNPATYIKVFDEIRSLFAQMPDAKVRGYTPGRFSFNRPGGRCEACEGNGATKLEMDFLADVWLSCPVCEGKRFNHETLQVRYRGKSIHDVLELSVGSALELFEHAPKIRGMLQTLYDVGLEYITLGQASPTLSGGEAQRIKLARELCKRGTGRTLYILDEPTTGLHFEDIRKLLQVLHGFADSGNTVVVIEHNLDVIKTADWIIDVGPEGGIGGGEIVFAGTPEELVDCPHSHTGKALQPVVSGVLRRLPGTNSPRSRRKGKAPEKIKELAVVDAHQHNLKHVNVRIPREKMTVCCGPSGSGKSSLAIDTIYAEGQRRYVESLSSYARQFLGQFQKPRVESVQGLSPAISIDQKTTSKSPRSTVGTITEIYDYLRVLYARLGQRYCPNCHLPIGTQSRDQIVERILGLPEGSKLYLLAPIARRGQERYDSLWEDIRRLGFVRIRVDGQSFSLDEPPAIDHRRKHAVEVVIDRNIVKPSSRSRIADSVETALELGRGVMHIVVVDADRPESQWRVERFSQHLACPQCGDSYEQLNPHHYSFNSPLGWCPTCEGLGFQRGANTSVLIRDPNRTLRMGAIALWPTLADDEPFTPFAQAILQHLGGDLDTCYAELTEEQQQGILYGTGETFIPVQLGPSQPVHQFQYKGLLPGLDEATRVSFHFRQKLAQLVDQVPCATCMGSRLRRDAAATRYAGLSMGQLTGLPLGDALNRLRNCKLHREEQQVAGELLREILTRLEFLVDVGLNYLSLARPGPTLSGGEAQRIRLASQIGSGLTGVLYVLDEPTIGLHPRDNARLLGALERLRDLGNTLLLVEHDREVIAAADHLLDFGPGAGDLGGEITAEGPVKKLLRSTRSLTGQYLVGKQTIPIPTNRRIPGPSLNLPSQPRKNGKSARSTKLSQPPSLEPAVAEMLGSLPEQHRNGKPIQWLRVLGARQHNLRNLDVDFPLSTLIAVTGVSGSGKSTLVHEILFSTLARRLHRAQTPAGAVDDIVGLEQIDKVINVDQDPIGFSPSSNPATYTGVFDLIRQLYSQLPVAKVRGYAPKRFSFNQPGGRCEACEGNGQKKIEMHFLPDVWIDCDVCQGKRYSPETLEVTYHDKSIADVLQLRVSEALELFQNIPKIRHILQTLVDVGLDYLTLGQAAPTLSGGEAQRVKLAAELARPSTGRTLYLLDEPTTGLHFDDIRKLLDVLHRLVDLGNTVLVVEHNLDVIKTADWIVDLGPEAGSGGGELVAVGTPEAIVNQAIFRNQVEATVSHTGRILAEVLQVGPYASRPIFDPHAAQIHRSDDLELDAVGRDAKLPWEDNGPRWHTQDRVSHAGKPSRWEGAILPWLETQIHALNDFNPTNWNHRSVVEIAAPKKADGWFLHAMTNLEWTVRLVFRVGRNSFKAKELISRLDIRPFDETEGVNAYGRESRIQVVNRKGPWQNVIILAHQVRELDTPAFRDFLQEATQSFHANIQRMKTTPESVMPWKVNGERWHLSDKGFAVGRPIRWERDLLKRLLETVRSVVPDVEISWDQRDAITLRLPGQSRAWARWRTKESEALDCRFQGPPSQFNLSQLEELGPEVELLNERQNGQVLHLRFTQDRQITPRLRAILLEQVAAVGSA